MKGSGKQILLKILKELSSKQIPEDLLYDSTDRIRAALLLHGSTSDENFIKARALSWANSPQEGPVERQGLAAQDGRVFLSDFFERVLEMPGLEEFILSSYDDFTHSDYEAAVWAIWALVTAPQMFSELLDVEVDDHQLDLEAWIDNMKMKCDHFSGNSGNLS